MIGIGGHACTIYSSFLSIPLKISSKYAKYDNSVPADALDITVKEGVLSPPSNQKIHTKRKGKERLVLGCQSFGNNVLPLFPGLHSEGHRLPATRQIKTH